MRWFPAVILTIGFCDPSRGELSLDPLFSDSMVLQRDRAVAIYGSGDTGTVVELEFDGQVVLCEVRDGKWRATLPSRPAGGPFNLVVKCGSEVLTLADILVGDVWVLAGQSNMARTMRTYNVLMDQLPDMEMHQEIRWFKMREGGVDLDEPTDHVIADERFEKRWQVSSRDLLPHFSPAGYFFSIHRYRMNRVPIGLIYATRGATEASCWIPKPVLEMKYPEILDPELNNNTKSRDGQPNPNRPSALYNGTVHPLHPFTIKGVLWYQGESDSRESERYRTLFPDLIRSWRTAWGQGDFPFAFVQLSSTKDRTWSILTEPYEEAWAWLREAQECALDLPHTAMVPAYDIGEWEDIHPQEKDEVGRRLAMASASLDGDDVIASGPVYAGYSVNGDNIVIRFDSILKGLESREIRMNLDKGFEPGADPNAFVAPADQLLGFTICGEDRVFHDAKAVINGNSVIVRSDKVPDPIAVRYAWRTFALANLFDKTGWPVLPFRTDDWPCPPLYRK